MKLENIRIILSRVSEAGNVGAVCRAMKNMQLSDLRLVSPSPLITDEIITRAVNSGDIWENAQHYDTLSEAICDCSIVVGTTRRRGQYRKNISMTPRDLAVWLAERSGQAAIVFGNERTGLEDAELDLCNFASHIPVSQTCPSLNLSHAVQLYAYELFLTMEEQLPVKGEWTAMNQNEIASLVNRITDTLANLGFYRNPGREEQARFLHDVFSRAGLAEREGHYIAEIFQKAARLGSQK